ncbi:MAG: hypothetical protein NVS4B8_10670 [Herpetosiphon sp.]
MTQQTDFVINVERCLRPNRSLPQRQVFRQCPRWRLKRKAAVSPARNVGKKMCRGLHFVRTVVRTCHHLHRLPPVTQLFQRVLPLLRPVKLVRPVASYARNVGIRIRPMTCFANNVAQI